MEIQDPRVDPALIPKGSKATVIAEHQDEHRNLPSIVTPAGQVITRWSLSDKERTAVLRGEDIFITMLAPMGVINPLFVTVGPVNWKDNET